MPNNWVDPNHEQTPQQLATLCFQALGVSVFDVSELPNLSRPEANWDHASPAQVLEKICSDLGCRVVPIRSIAGWSIQKTGVGNALPDGFPYEDWGQGIDPKETPDYIKIVSGPIRYQVFLPLGAIGKDIDLSWKPLQYLSYAPHPELVSGGFYDGDPINFQTLGAVRLSLPDGTKISQQELARDTVFKSWRLDFANQAGARRVLQVGTRANRIQVWAINIPGVTAGPVTIDQIILSDKLVQSYSDNLGKQHERPAFIVGSFFGDLTDGGDNPNYPPGTRIDKQAYRADTGMDERASFSLSLDPIDTHRSIISTSKPMMYYTQFIRTPVETWTPAILQYCCAINIRDPNTWQPVRYEYLYQIGSGTNPNFCRTVIKDDIQPWVIGNYPVGSTAFTSFTSNFDEVVLQSQYYAESIAQEYAVTASQTRTYIGIYPIDMDGSIQQVSYSIGKSGSSTVASQGTEHSIVTPQFEERRQQSARQGIAQKVEYAQYETARRSALLGSYNT